MARPAPGAHRSIAVLQFLSRHPDERYTLSEVARQCGLNKATAHALLSTLSDHGVLLRHPDEKRYSLGPTLVSLGHAAQRGYRAEDFAPGTLDALARATGLAASATRLEGNQLVTFAVARSADNRHRPSPIRLPLAPPVGGAFVAWAGAGPIESWLARARSEAAVRVGLSIVAALQRDGFLVARATPAWAGLAEAAGAVPDSAAVSGQQRDDVVRALQARDRVRRALADLAAEEPVVTAIETHATYAVDHVTAPVFDASGHVSLAVDLSDVKGGTRAGSEVRELVAAVVDAADWLTSAVCGRRRPRT